MLGVRVGRDGDVFRRGLGTNSLLLALAGDVVHDLVGRAGGV